PVAGRVAGKRRRERRVLQLEWVAGDDPDPRHTGGNHGREADDVVLDDYVGPELPEELSQAVVDVACAVDQLLPDRQDEAFELLDCRLAELGCRLADEVLPELPGRLLDLRRRLEPYQGFLEALRLERARERLLDHEDDPGSAGLKDLRDADAVVRRAVRALRKEDDDWPVAQAFDNACSRSAQSSSTSSSPTLRRSRFSGTRSPSQRRRLSSTESTPPRLVAFVIVFSDVSTCVASPETSNDSNPPKPG